jgi:hypothetical protein
MVRVRGSGTNIYSAAYMFILYRHKSLEKTKLRLELGLMMKWEMHSSGTIVLFWDEGSMKKETVDIFKRFAAKKKDAAATDSK